MEKWIIIGAVAYYFLVRRTGGAARSQVNERIDDSLGGLGDQVAGWVREAWGVANPSVDAGDPVGDSGYDWRATGDGYY